MMRIARLVLLGLLAGFASGIVLSEVIGIVGVVAFDREIGVQYLALYLAAAFGIASPILVSRRRR
jgi:Family of unknown function (DUF5957)